MKRSKIQFKSILRFVSLAGLLILFFIFIDASWETPDDHTISKGIIITEEEPLTISRPIVQEFEIDSLKLQMVAENAQVFEQKQITKLSDIKIQLFNTKSNNAPTKIVAQSGEMKSESGIMRLWGQVRIDTGGDQTLKTEEIFLNQKRNTIYNESNVRVTTEHDEIISSALHYDISTGVLILKKPEAKIKL